MNISITLLITLLGIQILWAQPSEEHQEKPLLAVIEIVNNTDQHHSFVAGMPDMLVTELMQDENMKLVERTKIQSALKALDIEASGLTKDVNLKLGEWLGADQIIIGAFNRIGQKYRLDIRTIDVKSGTIYNAASVSKTYSEFLLIIPEAGKILRNKLNARYQVGNESVENTEEAIVAETEFEVHCTMKVGLFTERPVPMQRVRIYIDSERIHTSRIINKLNKEFVLFNGTVPPGKHTVRLEHGRIDRKGKWKKSLTHQPKPFQIYFLENRPQKISYIQRIYERQIKYSTR